MASQIRLGDCLRPPERRYLDNMGLNRASDRLLVPDLEDLEAIPADELDRPRPGGHTSGRRRRASTRRDSPPG